MPIQAAPERYARALIPTLPPPLPSTTTSTSTDTSSSTTTATTSSTSSTSTSSSSSSSTTSGTSSSSSTTDTSSTSNTSNTSSTPSASSTTPLTTSTLSTTTTNPGGTVTITSTQVSSNPTLPAVATSAASTSSKGFFQNTGAVAGVFTAVGLVAVVIVIAIIVNIVRRRQAQKFDREIAEAAAEAAVARAPAFLDDDTDNYGPGGYGGTFAAKYSDVSHGTYSQPPMTESYGMREMVPGEVYDPAIYGAAGIGAGTAGIGAGAAGIGAGAAGIGVARARSRGDFAAGLQEGASPYPAFAGPRYDVHNVSRSPPPGFAPTNPAERDLLDAAGLGGVHRGPSQQSYQTNYADLAKARSLTAPSLGSSSLGSSNQGQPHRQLNPPSALQPGVQRNASLQTTSLPYASGSPEPPQSSPLPNPFASSSESDEHQDDGAESEPEEEPRRVLRVANE